MDKGEEIASESVKEIYVEKIEIDRLPKLIKRTNCMR